MGFRDDYARLLKRADRLGVVLAERTDEFLPQVPVASARARLIRCVFGIRAWRMIQAARLLIRASTDDPAGILARHTFELAIEAEYVSTDTVRKWKDGHQALSTDDKVGLYLEYYFVDMKRSGYSAPPAAELDQAVTRRKDLGIKGNLKWHGSTTLGLCEELDDAVPLRDPDTRQQNYKSVYRTLSTMFVHPNWRGTPWLDVESNGGLSVARKWECDELFSTTLLYSLRVMRSWNETLGAPKKKMLTRLLNDSASVAEKAHESWLSKGYAR